MKECIFELKSEIVMKLTEGLYVRQIWLY